MTKLKTLAAAVAVAAATLMAPLAHAAYSATFQGTTLTIAQVNATTFTLRVQNLLNGGTGDWATVTQYGAIAFNNIGTGFTGATITPDGSSGLLSTGLNASGCGGGGTGFLCFSFAPAPYVAASDNDLFTIVVTGANLNFGTDPSLGPELKFQMLDANGSKAGSLYSQRLPFSSTSTTSTTSTTGGGTSTGNVPEPGTGALALLGLGLLGAGFAARRKQSGAAV